jgi:hypothetical protein
MTPAAPRGPKYERAPKLPRHSSRVRGPARARAVDTARSSTPARVEDHTKPKIVARAASRSTPEKSARAVAAAKPAVDARAVIDLDARRAALEAKRAARPAHAVRERTVVECERLFDAPYHAAGGDPARLQFLDRDEMPEVPAPELETAPEPVPTIQPTATDCSSTESETSPVRS